MIHIATVHWKDDRWVNVQLDYLHRYITEPFRVYAWLNDVPPVHSSKYYYATAEAVEQHAIKLNLLADIIYFNSDRDRDLIIFVDGDAFPIGDVVGFARLRLEDYPLLAVQRRENNGDLQPHPCFCVTSVGFWKRIGGDWKRGHTWPDRQGNPTTDVGGNLLGILERQGVNWYPMLRSNRLNLHPVWFGVYEDLVYHHGASFRNPLSREDLRTISIEAGRTWRGTVARAIDRLSSCHRALWRLQRFNPLWKMERHLVHLNREMNQRGYEKIIHDPEFYRALV